MPPSAIASSGRRRFLWRGRILYRIGLHDSGTAITLNGIAQGFAADAAMHALKRHGVEHALIDTGEFRAIGSNTDGCAWGIGIRHPRIENALVSIARLEDRCLATSGD